MNTTTNPGTSLLAVLCLVLTVFVPHRHASGQEISDPLEPVNRAIFQFNDTIDVYAVEPLAKTYDKAVPDRIKLGVKNFFANLNYPILLVSDLAQLKFSQAGVHTQRFIVNSTVGLFGVMDIAKKHNLPPHEEDLGTAFGYWGVPAGPYLVLPLLGPSNLRDGLARIPDSYLSPEYHVDSWEATLSLRVVNLLDQRRRLLDATKTGKESSLDYYEFVKSTYHQYRQNLIYDGEVPEEHTGEGEEPKE